MVKLQLGAIKASVKTSETTPAEKTPAPASKNKAQTATTQAGISTSKKIELPQKPGAAPKTAVQQKPSEAKNLPQTSKPKLSLENIKAGSEKLEAEKKAEREKQASIDAQKEPEIFPIGASCELKNIELFPAYTSKFKKKQWGLLQKIKELKRMPKTNKMFISILIGSTILWIWMLFILAPEKHNLDYYKTSLLDNYHHVKENGLFSKEDPINIPDPVIVPDIIEPDEAIGSWSLEEESINNSGSANMNDLNEQQLDDLINGGGDKNSSDLNNDEVLGFISGYTGSIRRADESDMQYYSRIKHQILNK